MSLPTRCPLCRSHDTGKYCEDDRRSYVKCRRCDLIFVPKRFHPSAESAKARYDLHRNSPNDPGYRSFLMGIVNPIVENVPKGRKGLDYGSGPTPVLTEMLRQRGYGMESYDIHYAANPSVLTRKYDFLTCCETAEHFSEPRKEWERFLALIGADGIIAVKTEPMRETRDFSSWHYIRDETHVCFYSKGTFRWLADFGGFTLEYSGNTALFRRGRDRRGENRRDGRGSQAGVG